MSFRGTLVVHWYSRVLDPACSTTTCNMAQKINIDKPRYDQSTFEGRAKYFFSTTNPLNVLASDAELDRAKQIVDDIRAGIDHPELTHDEIWHAKELYDSAFHPQTGEKLFIMGRMSFQVPGNMSITGCMLTFYKSTPAVIFWQFANQTFNTIVNYSNRNATAGVTNEQLMYAYAAATTTSVGAALLFNKVVATLPVLAPVARFVPFLAVAAANCANIPLMRQQELKQGITIQTADGKEVGKSVNAAVSAISQVVPSRIGMAVPGMILPPIIMSKLEKTAMLVKNPWLKAPITVLLTGACLTLSTPLCCALFPQEASISLDKLDANLQQVVKEKFPNETTFYYNKGL